MLRIRSLLAATFAVLLAALFSVVSPAAAGTAKPTIVLVHGAFADATSWDGVAANLRGRGYAVITPDNALRGPRFDAARLEKVLADIHGPVILAGHSYGGAVITEAHSPNVEALVYIAAFGPTAGEPVMANLDPFRFPGSRLIPPALEVEIVQDNYGTGIAGKNLDAHVAPRLFREVFAQDVSPATAANMIAHQKSAAVYANLEPISNPSWRSTPSWYLISENDRVIPPAAQRFMAQRMGAHTSRVAASHASLVSQPAIVADTIVAAATS